MFLFLGATLFLSACSPGPSVDPTEPVPAVESRGSAPDQDPVQDLVLITVDTLRFDAVGFGPAGRWQTPTPHLQPLADEGRVFDLALAHAPLTLPSHASLLTGLYPYQHGVRENAGFVLQPEAETVTEMLKEAGYQTAAFVSAFVLDARFGLAQGFDVYGDQISRSGSFQVSERRGDETVTEALEWWRGASGGPRFLWLHLFDPHAPYAAPDPWSNSFDHAYRGEVAAVDNYLAPLIEELRGADSRPLVVFTADHGEALGEHGELTHGIFAYQSTLQVPMFLWGPGIEPGRVASLVRHIDVKPTLLEAAGLPVSAELPGRSLLSVDDGARLSYFEALSGVLNRGWAPLRGTVRADGQGTTKYIDLPLAELYDLAEDPGEERDLIQDRRRDAAELRGLLPEESQWPPVRSQISSEEEARLRSLGYLSDDGGGRQTFTAADDPKRLIELDRDIHRFSELFAAGDRESLEAAVEVARSLVERRPDMAVGHSQLAQALLQLDRRSEALQAMQAARARGAAGPTLLRQLGLTLLESGRAGEAVGVLEPLAETGDPEAMGALAAALSEATLSEATLSEATLSEAAQPEQGDLTTARRWMEKALKAAPDDGGLHEKAAVLALKGQDPATALKHARRSTELQPESAPGWNHLGVALFLQGRPLEALEAWQRCIALDPDQFDTLYNLGVQAAELGRPDLARRSLEDFVARAPADRYAEDLPKARFLLQRLAP